MNTKTLQTFGSIAGLALLLGGTFVSPASARITTQVSGPMNTRGGYINKTGFDNLKGFINNQVTNSKFADLWGGSGTIIPASVKTGNSRLDRQNPSAEYANIQVQEGGATFATVLIPKKFAQLSTNPAARAAQTSELMNQLRKGLRESAWSTRRDLAGNQPKIYVLTGNFSN
jgi:hypothetical protein